MGDRSNSESFLRAILEGLPAGILAADARTHRLLFVNDSVCKLLGYAREELLELCVKDLHPPEDLERALAEFGSAGRGEALLAEDLSIMRGDGSVFPADIECCLLEIDGRSYVLGVLTDITHRKCGEAALRESEVRNRTILQAIPDLMFINDREGEYLDCHAAEPGLLAFDSRDILRKNIRDVFPEEMSAAIFERFEQAHSTRQVQVIDYSLDLVVGRRYFEARILAMDEGRQLTIVRDVTERKRAEESRRRLRELESLGTVAGGIAHDFNNLLMGVFGNIKLAERTLPSGHPSLSSLSSAYHALEDARQLTSRLLTFAKGGNPVLETVDLRQRILDTVRFNLAGSNVAAGFDIPSTLWPIKADCGQIAEVISNLTINAKEAMPSGGTLHVHAENVEGLREDELPGLVGDYVKLAFRDEGTGIPSRIIGRVFDPYFTTKKAGSGLGLAIVYGIVGKHQGRIDVDSVSDVGTTFTIFLPADKEAYAQELAARSAEPEALPPVSGRILLMDDEEMVRNVTSQMIQHLGFEVDTAPNGEEAVESFVRAMNEGRPYALTILDLTVPGGMGGKETIGELLSIDPSAKVIVASGYSSDPVLADCTDHGFLGRLEKPYNFDDLTQVLSRALKPEE